MKHPSAIPPDLNGINSGLVTFSLAGFFQKRAVTWLCTLQTLEHYYLTLLGNQQITANETITLKKFIHIKDENSETPRIDIGLDVDRIDIPTVRKSIIMIHNYKNLRAGIHEYGTACHYPGN